MKKAQRLQWGLNCAGSGSRLIYLGNPAIKVYHIMAAWICLFLTTVAVSAAQERPNFIILIADDVSASDVGAFGHPHVRTPNIDRLAQAGMRMDCAFLTTSSCSPSRSSILSGRYPHNTGAGELHLPLPAEQILMTEPLREAGYFTAASANWHLGEAARAKFDRVVDEGGPSGCEAWVKLLDERPRDRPFFLWLASHDAHRPFLAGKVRQLHTADDAVVPSFLPDVPEVREELAIYYDEISRMDSYLGQVLDALDEQGQSENTVVLFLADNGRPFPRCKHTVYDSGVRTPLILRWPAKVQADSVVANLVSVIDIAPTFLELAGLTPGPSFQGRSFATLFEDSSREIRRYVFSERNWHDFQSRERGVRSKEFLYIRNAFAHLPRTPPLDVLQSKTYGVMRDMWSAGTLSPGEMDSFVEPRPAEELYRTKDDPHQMNNLAEVPQYAKVLEEMREAYSQWAERTGDVVPDSPTPDGYDRETGRSLFNVAHPSFRKKE